MGNATALFEQFKAEGAALVHRAVAEKWPEDGYLDFKLVSKAYPPGQSSDWNTLATAISAFANADGGLLVWGVLATDGSRKSPAIAVEARPLTELARFVRDLNRETSRLTAPLVPGVVHCALLDSAAADTGFVVTFVPKGESDPVAQLNDGVYHLRVGDSFVRMDHWMIADRFRRRPQPALALALQVWRGSKMGTGGPNAYVQARVAIGIQNRGRGIRTTPEYRD